LRLSGECGVLGRLPVMKRKRLDPFWAACYGALWGMEFSLQAARISAG